MNLQKSMANNQQDRVIEVIKTAMYNNGITAKELSEAIHIDPSSLSLFFNGKKELGYKKVDRILKHLGVSYVQTLDEGHKIIFY